MNKGEYGHINQYKRQRLIILAVLLLIIAIITGTCYAMYHTTKKPIIVLAILTVLPAAKVLVNYIIVAKSKSLSANEKEELDSYVEKFDNAKVLYDLALSSTENVKYAPYVVIINGNITGYVPEKYTTDNCNNVNAYINKLLKKGGYEYSSYLKSNKKKFYKELEKLSQNEEVSEKVINSITEILLVVSIWYIGVRYERDYSIEKWSWTTVR